VNNLTKRETPDRSKINLQVPRQAKYWAHEPGVSKDQLRKLVEKVGNSATAVRRNSRPDGGKSMAYPTEGQVRTRAHQLWEQSGRSTGLGGYRTGVTENQLRDAPKYRNDNDWNWGDMARNRTVNTYYGVPVA
jgi:hypothetical protein